MNELFKYLVQETDAVRKTNNLIVKIVFWINCAALTISIVESLGYTLDESFTLDVKGLIKLFSQQQLVLGLMIICYLTFPFGY